MIDPPVVLLPVFVAILIRAVVPPVAEIFVAVVFPNTTPPVPPEAVFTLITTSDALFAVVEREPLLLMFTP